MLVLLLAQIPVAAAGPLDLSAWAAIEVDYTMETTGRVRCATTYRGTGRDPVVEGDRITFAGTWEVVSDTCEGNTIWVPDDGRAHHTLRLAPGGKRFEEWLVHARAADHQRFTSEIKARGQYWINELDVAPADGVLAYTTRETQGMGPLTLTIDHRLRVALRAEPPAPEGSAPEAPAEEAAGAEAPIVAPTPVK